MGRQTEWGADVAAAYRDLCSVSHDRSESPLSTELARAPSGSRRFSSSHQSPGRVCAPRAHWPDRWRPRWRAQTVARSRHRQGAWREPYARGPLAGHRAAPRGARQHAPRASWGGWSRVAQVVRAGAGQGLLRGRRTGLLGGAGQAAQT